ncbi:MAG: rhodanese-like domain-containing protein [Lachnospiraceae bacterium]
MEEFTISARDVDRYIYDEDTIIADLRSAEEYMEYHIKNSVNFPDDSIFDKLYVLDKYKLIILCCDRGVNSLITAKKLKSMRYNVKSVVGGMNFYRQSHKR